MQMYSTCWSNLLEFLYKNLNLLVHAFCDNIIHYTGTVQSLIQSSHKVTLIFTTIITFNVGGFHNCYRFNVNSIPYNMKVCQLYAIIYFNLKELTVFCPGVIIIVFFFIISDRMLKIKTGR